MGLDLTVNLWLSTSEEMVIFIFVLGEPHGFDSQAFLTLFSYEETKYWIILIDKNF